MDAFWGGGGGPGNFPGISHHTHPRARHLETFQAVILRSGLGGNSRKETVTGEKINEMGSCLSRKQEWMFNQSIQNQGQDL